MRKYVIGSLIIIALVVLTACDDNTGVKRVTDLGRKVEIVCIDDVLYFAAQTYNAATDYSPKYKSDNTVETCELDDEHIDDLEFYGDDQ